MTAGEEVAAPRSWWLQASADVEVSPLVVGSGTADVLVVGLGASGLEAVVRLTERGADVVGLDAAGVAGGAAGANGGFLLAGMADFHHDAVRRHGRASAVSWWHRTAAELERVLADEPTARRTGSLRIAATAEEEVDIRAHLTAMQVDGLPAEAYAGPEGVGLLVTADGVVDPAARCRRLARRALAAGARLMAPARVLDLRSVDPGVDALVAGGPGIPDVPWVRTVRARQVLVCVDGGLERVRVDGRHPAALRPVRSVRLQMLATEPDTDVHLTRPVYRRHGYDYVHQRPTGEVLLGGGRDIGGDDEWAPPIDRPAGPPIPSEAVQQHLDGWLADLGVTARVTDRWAAWAAFTPDRLPVDAEVAAGVRVLGGYSGHGNLIGGMLAREAAEDILDRRA